MDKQKVIVILEAGHEQFGEILQQSAPRQIESIPNF